MFGERPRRRSERFLKAPQRHRFPVARSPGRQTRPANKARRTAINTHSVAVTVGTALTLNNISAGSLTHAHTHSTDSTSGRLAGPALLIYSAGRPGPASLAAQGEGAGWGWRAAGPAGAEERRRMGGRGGAGCSRHCEPCNPPHPILPPRVSASSWCPPYSSNPGEEGPPHPRPSIHWRGALKRVYSIPEHLLRADIRSAW